MGDFVVNFEVTLERTSHLCSLHISSALHCSRWLKLNHFIKFERILELQKKAATFFTLFTCKDKTTEQYTPLGQKHRTLRK